eukprot:485729-Hanusia_phi.AAC.1
MSLGNASDDRRRGWSAAARRPAGSVTEPGRPRPSGPEPRGCPEKEDGSGWPRNGETRRAVGGLGVFVTIE